MRATAVRSLTLMLVAIAAAAAFGHPPLPASAGGDRCHQAPEYEHAGTDVKMIYNCFSPSVLRVEPGTDVVFHNHDEVIHGISGIPNKAPGETRLAVDQTYTATFSQPGVYPYFCNLHFGMVGAVVVGDYKSAGTGVSSASAIQAAQPRSGDEAAAAPASAGRDDDSSSRWPLVGGAALAVAGVASGAAIARRARRS